MKHRRRRWHGQRPLHSSRQLIIGSRYATVGRTNMRRLRSGIHRESASGACRLSGRSCGQVWHRYLPGRRSRPARQNGLAGSTRRNSLYLKRTHFELVAFRSHRLPRISTGRSIGQAAPSARRARRSLRLSPGASRSRRGYRQSSGRGHMPFRSPIWLLLRAPTFHRAGPSARPSRTAWHQAPTWRGGTRPSHRSPSRIALGRCAGPTRNSSKPATPTPSATTTHGASPVSAPSADSPTADDQGLSAGTVMIGGAVEPTTVTLHPARCATKPPELSPAGSEHGQDADRS